MMKVLLCSVLMFASVKAEENVLKNYEEDYYIFTDIIETYGNDSYRLWRVRLDRGHKVNNVKFEIYDETALIRDGYSTDINQIYEAAVKLGKMPLEVTCYKLNSLANINYIVQFSENDSDPIKFLNDSTNQKVTDEEITSIVFYLLKSSILSEKHKKMAEDFFMNHSKIFGYDSITRIQKFYLRN